MTALLWVFEFVFECRHRNLGHVFTIKNRTYQVCFECGQEVEYSWELMRSAKSVIVCRTDAPLSSVSCARLPAA
jgi:hypothetical protein